MHLSCEVFGLHAYVYSDEVILCYMSVIVLYLHIYMMKNHAPKITIDQRPDTGCVFTSDSFSYY